MIRPAVVTCRSARAVIWACVDRSTSSSPRSATTSTTAGRRARMNKPFAVHRLMPNDVISEDSAAQQFVELHGDTLRYCHSHGKWFRWNGFYWEINNTSLAFHFARELARQLAEDQENRKRYKIE